jgi:hypothetical protein
VGACESDFLSRQIGADQTKTKIILTSASVFSRHVRERPHARMVASFPEAGMHSLRLALALVFASSTGLAQEIPATEAARHIGENATVCGTIASEHTATSTKGTPTFLNLDRPYPHQVFTLLVLGGDRDRVGKVPESGRICGVGTISTYRGSQEIVLRDRKSWYVPQ